MRPLVKRWRSMGHVTFIYLDDGFGSQPDKTSACAASLIQRKELHSSGLLCNWVPMQIGEWLGFLINTIAMVYQIPEKKLSKLKGLLDLCISDGHCTYRFLAKIAGSVISCALAVGPIARLFTRQMYLTIETRLSWDSVVHFSPGLLEELRFWYLNLDCFNGYSIRPPPTSSTLVFSDASDSGFGGYSASLDGSTVSGMFTSTDIGQSSTYRELKAIYYVCLAYLGQLRNKKVKVFTDNQGAARIVSIGSSKAHLQRVALDIFQICLRNNIVLEAQWIPRSENEKADLLSRFLDKDDWSVPSSVFNLLNHKWGPFTIDRFTSYYNAQLPRFNSRFASPGCCAVDALVQNWSNENDWLCPPINLIVPSLRVLEACRGRGTLIVPEWPSSYFWPFLHQSNGQFPHFIKDVFVLPKISDLLVEGPGQKAFFADIFESSAWEVRLIKDPSLVELVPNLVNLQLNSKAPSTVHKYQSSWLKWRGWACSKYGVSVIPAEPIHIALYLTELAYSAKEKGTGVSGLDTAVYSLAWAHRLAGLQTCPTDHPLVKGTLEGAKRMLARPLNRKEPLTLELVERITAAYSASESLAVLRFLFILLVGYAGFFRINEVQSIRLMDISVYNDQMFLFIPKRKNDQFREGHTSLIARSDKATCPVNITEKLIRNLPANASPSSPVIRRIIKTKRTERYHDTRGVSYTTIREEFRKLISPFVTNINNYGAHSIKSGAASNPGCRSIKGDLLDKHAGWRCPSSKFRYINIVQKILFNENPEFTQLCVYLIDMLFLTVHQACTLLPQTVLRQCVLKWSGVGILSYALRTLDSV
ncbi:Integrase/recombinase xerD-like [Exaiptasia diaphana]|nr:Integrase/recombinase xerD-like [Exaiptasia diaphana]